MKVAECRDSAVGIFINSQVAINSQPLMLRDVWNVRSDTETPSALDGLMTSSQTGSLLLKRENQRDALVSDLLGGF